MTADRSRLEQRRDQALRDLVDLERQVGDGELPADVADGLRQTYERTAATALALLAAPTPDGEAAPQPPDRSSWRGRWAAYGLALAVALFAAVVLLPVYLGERPTGGAVSGNEALGSALPAQGGTAPRDLSTVTNEEMEDVVAENPDVLDMRLALAHRYLDEADYLAAARHYLVALDREPRNVEAQSHYGWLLMQTGEPDQAIDYVDRALAQDPREVEALWFKANIVLYGLSDPAGALTVLDELQQRTDLEPETGSQVEALIAAARAQGGAG